MTAQLKKLLCKVFPEGKVELPWDAERGYLRRICGRLTRDLQRIPDACVFYERSPEGGEVRDGVSSEPVPNVNHHSTSYHLFFVGLTKESLTYTCEDAQTYWQDQGVAIETSAKDEAFPFTGEGQGWIGCTLAVSILARFALIAFDTYEVYADGGNTIPDFRPHIYDMESRPIDMEQHMGETMGVDAVIALHSLRDAIQRILRTHRIEVLASPEADEVVPWLVPGEETLRVAPGSPVTVRDALFFEQL